MPSHQFLCLTISNNDHSLSYICSQGQAFNVINVDKLLKVNHDIVELEKDNNEKYVE